MAEFFAELKRRQMFRVAAAYAVVAWLLLQVFNNLAPILKLPDWAGTLILVLLIGGLPIILLFAWIHQFASTDGAAAKITGLDFGLLGALVLVIAIFSYQQISSSSVSARSQGKVENAPAGAISVAVLPFANLSGDASQEFFSDGMTEEITSALAKVPNLRVIGRTSAFQFRGQNKNFSAIRQALSVAYLIDGSVRREGDRVRITAQLVEADNGANVWTETYDRQLTSVFATQEDIAQAIAGALRVPLGLEQGETLVRDRISDPEVYDKYLRAKALIRQRGIQRLRDGALLLEQVVASEADFAPAWALLALAYTLIPTASPERTAGSVALFRPVVEEFIPKAEAAAQRAVELSPNLADGYVPLGIAQVRRARLVMAEEFYAKALALDPNHADAMEFQSNLLAGVGRVKESLPLKQRVLTLEPFTPTYRAALARVFWLNGQDADAIAILNEVPTSGRIELARILASAGRYADAANALPPEIISAETLEAASRLLRSAPAVVASPQTLPRLGGLDFVYLHVGAIDRVLDSFEEELEAGYQSVITNSVLWHRSYAAVRKTEQFKSFVRKAGYVDYWRAKGWPDLCRPIGADDFVCD